jgi:mono/diheme cytochrome c family protein
MSRGAKITLVLLLVVVLGTVALMGPLLGGGSAAAEQQVAKPAPIAVLEKPISDSMPDAAQIRRGQYLIIAGDCVGCHTNDSTKPFAGNFALNSPFGVIYSTNLTPDVQTGIGALTPDQFYAALHDGIGPRGAPIYPAMPYPYMTRVTRADSDAMLAFLKTVPAVSETRRANNLAFPFNVRFLVNGWNMLFFRRGEFAPDPGKTAEWNRGAYLITGAGHCGACHTPKNAVAADKDSQALQGGNLDNWVEPDLTANMRTGLGKWSADDIVEYLKTGRNARANAGASMAEVVTNSTSLMTDQDLHAMAVYLKDLPAGPDATPAAPDAGAMKRGGAVYSDACTSCHMEKAVGQPRIFPPLGDNAVVQQNNPDSVIRVILAGDRTAPTRTRPATLSMPSFAWKLNDQQVADVATYIRNSWGNAAAPVTAPQVADMRKRLDLATSRLTDNSTDR